MVHRNAKSIAAEPETGAAQFPWLAPVAPLRSAGSALNSTRCVVVLADRMTDAEKSEKLRSALEEVASRRFDVTRGAEGQTRFFFAGPEDDTAADEVRMACDKAWVRDGDGDDSVRVVVLDVPRQVKFVLGGGAGDGGAGDGGAGDGGACDGGAGDGGAGGSSGASAVCKAGAGGSGCGVVPSWFDIECVCGGRGGRVDSWCGDSDVCVAATVIGSLFHTD